MRPLPWFPVALRMAIVLGILFVVVCIQRGEVCRKVVRYTCYDV